MKKKFFNKNILKEVEKLPKKIKLSLEEGKSVDNGNKLDKNLNSVIYRCINIENNIEEINLIKEKMKKVVNYMMLILNSFLKKKKKSMNF